MSNSSSSSVCLLPCRGTRTDSYVLTAFIVLQMLLFLPLSILVLCLGYQRWRERRSATSHSDILTYNMVAIEIVGALGCALYLSCSYTEDVTLRLTGGLMLFFKVFGENQFHCLTCVERYLAVIHPVTYRSLRQGGGVRLRNISVACVWLLSFGCMALTLAANLTVSMITSLLSSAVSLMGIAFWSLSVLCALIRPGPGQAGGNRKRVDQSKQRAFHTLATIMAALLLRFGGNLVYVMISFAAQTSDVSCKLAAVMVCFDLPSSLVLPLLFLHRAGRPPGCRANAHSGSRVAMKQQSICAR